MNILDTLQQLQQGEAQPVAGDDMDFMMPKNQPQKPGMKGQADLDKFMQNRAPELPQLDEDSYPLKGAVDNTNQMQMNILKDQIENIPRAGLEGMPMEQLNELYKFQRRQRGEPEGDDERILEDVQKQMGAPPKNYSGRGMNVRPQDIPLPRGGK